MKRIVALALVFALLVMTGCGSIAAGSGNGSYPSKQIEIIIPYSAGGVADLTTRAITPSLEEKLGQTTVIVCKPGASGVIGFNYIASAKKDGYTIGFVPLSSVCINNVLGELEINPLDGYELLGGVTADPVALCVSADSPFNSLKELVDYAKEHPGELTIAASGMTSMDTVMCLDLEEVAGVDFNVIDFDGGSESIAAIIGGHADVMGGTYGEMAAYANAGQLKILAVGAQGLDYPSFDEEGYSISLTTQVRSFIAPKGMDETAKATLVEAIRESVAGESFAANLKSMDSEPTYLSPEELTEYVKTIMSGLQKFSE